MAKDNTHEVTVTIDVDKLGVSTRDHFLKATDEDYRREALKPPGGYGPGEGGKDEDPPSGDVPPEIVAQQALAVS